MFTVKVTASCVNYNMYTNTINISCKASLSKINQLVNDHNQGSEQECQIQIIHFQFKRPLRWGVQLMALCTSTSLILNPEYRALINGVSELLNNTLHPLSASFLYTLASCTWSSRPKPSFV